LALSDWIDQQTVTCDSDKLDKYKRHLARCSVAGQDLGEWMASNGWTVPYRECKCEVVRSAANTAKAAKLGIWSGNFVMPWDWRAQQVKQTTAEPSAEQLQGRAHLPRAGEWYDATKIDESRGERWFCSEAETQAAGWRPAKP
jgi:Staphylococcal nuclease homologue